MSKKFEKSMKRVNIEGEHLLYDLKNVNKISGKDVADDKIKSQK